jgi:UDP-N-acetylmuramoyl-L-alanyl-D-glutamate--2,6-diaminopimelate ligase
MENYFNAKKILFDGLNDKSKAISNMDDEYGADILAGCQAVQTYYSINSDSDFRADNVIINLNGLKFDLHSAGKRREIVSPLTGRFNVYNILAAIACCVNLGIDLDVIISGIRKFEAVKGRFNKIILPNNSCAIIDYSHTSDSLKNAIEAAIEVRKNEEIKGRVITIFGCGGNRDRTKRPVMGSIATELSDYVIITSDNPRFENPNDIINEIKSGIKKNTFKNANYDIEPDRDAAIKKGIEMSKEGDIILICGKGHETYQEIGGIKSHFDDKEVVIKYESLVKF